MLNEIASDNEVHPNMPTRWKTEATNSFHLLFENENVNIRKQYKEYGAQIDELHRQTGGLWQTLGTPIFQYPHRLKC